MSIGKALYDKYFGGKMKDIKETIDEVNETFEDKTSQGEEQL